MEERLRTGPARMAVALAWLVVGAMVVDQVRLPELPRPRPAGSPAAVACWAVRVTSGPASAQRLRRDLRRLRRAGLPASLRPGQRPDTRVLLVPARSRSAARAARDRAVRLGFAHSMVRRLPRAACRR